MLKTCPRCGVEKPIEDFGVARKRANGRSSWCKTCHREYDREWKSRNPERVRASYRRKSLKKRYGITAHDYERLHESQGGLCAICGQPERLPDASGQPRRLAVDHDKATGLVRGLLCRLCNQRLGAIGDNREGISRFLRYVDEPPAAKVALDGGPRWSRHYAACIECGRPDRPYGAHGRCHTCDVRLTRNGIAPPPRPELLIDREV